MSTNRWVHTVIVSMALVALLGVTPIVAGSDSRVYSTDVVVNGLGYGDWSALWWQWVFSVPSATNPLNDTTGAWAGNGQSGKVFFLGGCFNISCDHVQREITVPKGKILFFPVLNGEADNFIGLDPDTNMSIAELRALANSWMDDAINLSCVLDGTPIGNLADYRTVSPVFDIFMTDGGIDTNRVYNIPLDQNRIPAVSDGFFLMLKPLSKGTHTLRFKGTIPMFGNFSIDVSYLIHQL